MFFAGFVTAERRCQWGAAQLPVQPTPSRARFWNLGLRGGGIGLAWTEGEDVLSFESERTETTDITEPHNFSLLSHSPPANVEEPKTFASAKGVQHRSRNAYGDGFERSKPFGRTFFFLVVNLFSV